MFSLNKDVEEFLAYNGGGEIEFVQEKTEIIPPAVRLDKVLLMLFLGHGVKLFRAVSDIDIRVYCFVQVVFRTVSGVVGKMTEKLTTPAQHEVTERAVDKVQKPSHSK